MDHAHLLLLIVHVATGTLALLAGTVVMAARKGNSFHGRMGRAFVVGQACASLSAIVLAILHPNSMLLYIGSFSLLLVVAGLRAVRARDGRVSPIDLGITTLGALNGLAMLITGHVVLMVFGGIAVFLAWGDVRMYRRKSRGMDVQGEWVRRHIGHMVGGYISTVSAFLVVNFSEDLGLVAWFAPTVVLVPFIVRWSRPGANLERRSPTTRTMAGAILLLACPSLKAQPYLDGGRTRHRFAQMTVGADVRAFTGNGSTHDAPANGGAVDGPPFAWQGRMLIGGTHFWGHAHFDLAFPLFQGSASGFRAGVETSARIFPWAIRYGRVRPYVGTSILPLRYRQGEGPQLEWIAATFTTGLVYARRGILLELGVTFDPAAGKWYPVDRERWTHIGTPPLWFTLAVRGMFDTTLGAEPGWRSGRTRQVTDTLAARGRLSGLTVSGGVSTAFALGSGISRESDHAWLPTSATSAPFPVVSVGYYLHGADLQVELVARRMHSEVSGHGAERSARRGALTLAAYRFLADVHGFAPFVGLSVGRETMAVFLKDGGEEVATGAWSGWRPGLIAGWDIRPDRIQRFYLRTALRWNPAQQVAMSDGRTSTAHQLEVDFIQLVLMPGRWR